MSTKSGLIERSVNESSGNDLSVLECEIIVHRTPDVKIDEDALHEVLKRKRKETLIEISSMVRQ